MCVVALARFELACPTEMQMLSLYRRAVSAVVLAGLGVACSPTAGGQTGEESQTPCIEAEVPLQRHEVSSLGFSADDLLTTVGDASTATLLWVPARSLSYGPESGASTITITILHVGNARFIESEVRANDSEALLHPVCQDRVELDVTLSSATAGGALSEEFATRLKAASIGDIWLSHVLQPAQLSGAFAIDAQSLGTARFKRLTLEAHWSPELMRGLISAGIEQASGTGPDASVSFTSMVVGCFSDGSANTTDCPPFL
jgi:hypothetical protein